MTPTKRSPLIFLPSPVLSLRGLQTWIQGDQVTRDGTGSASPIHKTSGVTTSLLEEGTCPPRPPSLVVSVSDLPRGSRKLLVGRADVSGYSTATCTWAVCESRVIYGEGEGRKRIKFFLSPLPRVSVLTFFGLFLVCLLFSRCLSP